MPRVAVGGHVHQGDVGLLGSRGEPGGRTVALDDEVDSGDLREVLKAQGLVHEGQARPRSRRHRPGAHPPCAGHHVGGGDLILGLNHRVGRLAVLVLAQPRRYRSSASARELDGVMGYPGAERDPAVDRAQGAGRVAFGDDLSVVSARDLLQHGNGLAQTIVLHVVVAQLDTEQVGLDDRGLVAEGVAQHLADGVHVDAEQIGQGAHVQHVALLGSQLDPLPRVSGRDCWPGRRDTARRRASGGPATAWSRRKGSARRPEPGRYPCPWSRR